LGGRAPASGFEMRIRRKNGERLDARFYLSPLIDLTGRQTGWMASMTDITEPKRVRAALEAAHERFEAVLDGLDAAVFVSDAGTDEILFANRAFKAIHGFDAVGRTVRGVAVPQPERGDYPVDPRGLTVTDLPRELFDGELQHPLSGRWYHVREHATRWVDGRVVRMGIATDITDRKQTAEISRQQEERLERTSRLITMGEMASTLAHELNQPLSAIANYCAGCVTRMQSGNSKPEDLLAAMQKARFQAERAGKIIRRIREFVKKSEPRRSAVRIAEVLDDALGFAEIDARRLGIRLVAEVAPDLPAVYADRIMIEQVVLNLVRNGLDAMSNVLPDERILIARARPFGPHSVEVAVIDRGHGLSDEDRARLFTPFFTTKAEGMGMGLNICRSIIEFHDGRLIVDVNPEGGTIFSFTLPTEAASERVARRA
ncbi:MAG: PAS domain-containing sensor histidine kinase, partial [Betaproteobacteria bacterium HGW-Betaproteobacteria-19]